MVAKLLRTRLFGVNVFGIFHASQSIMNHSIFAGFYHLVLVIVGFYMDFS